MSQLVNEPAVAPETLACLNALERKVLWLSSWMVHNANHLRPARDGLKVGGHQASCASVATLMTALYFDVLGPNDRVAVKPHASPVFHAIPVPLRQPDQGQAGRLPRLRRRAELPVADQGQRRRGHLHRLRRPRGGDDALRIDGPGLRALPQARAGEARARPHDRRRGRCRARRGQRLRGAAGGLEARCPQPLVDHRL